MPSHIFAFLKSLDWPDLLRLHTNSGRKIWINFKVRIFWEGHKIWKNLSLKIWHYSLTSNFKWKIFSNFVVFSEYPNFKAYQRFIRHINPWKKCSDLRPLKSKDIRRWILWFDLEKKCSTEKNGQQKRMADNLGNVRQPSVGQP